MRDRHETEIRLCMLQLRRDKPPLDGALPQLRQLEYHERGRCSRGTQGGDSCCSAGCCGSSGGRDYPDRPTAVRDQHHGGKKPHPDRHLGAGPRIGRRHRAGRRGAFER